MSRRRLAATLGFLLFLALVVGAQRLFLASLPQTTGTVAVPGMEAEVTVARDGHGIPTIRAGSEADLYRAVGFVHAQDRLWQMAFNRRLAQGRLAEVVGASALPFDRLFRTLDLAGAAAASLDAVAPDVRVLLAAYAEGVNACLATGAGPLPPEFQLLWTGMEPWRPEDSLLMLKLVAFDLAGNWRSELRRARLARALPPERLGELWPPSPVDEPLTYERLAGLDLERLVAALPVERPAAASNVWVVGGRRSATGMPLLANDPHLGLAMPSTWYAARLEAPGIDVAGATLPGVPTVVLGQSRAVAWGVTNPGFDLQDLFVETPAAGEPGSYAAPGGVLRFAVREETIGVRFGAAERLVVRSTRHGPVISDLMAGSAGGPALALSWTGLDRADRTIEAGFAAARAVDAASFRAAFARFANPPLNVAYADGSGTIGMLTVGTVPVRAHGDGRLPVDGASGAGDWTGTLPAAALPSAVDPKRGWIANANNRLVGPGFASFLAADWDPPWRVRRIGGLLESPERLDLGRMRRIQLDLHSGIVDDLRPWLVELRTAAADVAQWRDRLLAWDGDVLSGSAEALVFWAWLGRLQGLVWDDELGAAAGTFSGVQAEALRHLRVAAPQWCDDRGTEPPETCADIGGTALAAALELLRARLGGDEAGWRWDALHVARLGHRPMQQVPGLRLLFSAEVQVGGDSSTVAVAHVDLDEPFASRHAASWRGLYDLEDRHRSRLVLPGGQSGHPASAHYRDMLRLWRDGGDLPLLAETDRPSRTLRLRAGGPER